MKSKILRGTGRFLAISLVAFGAATIANRQHHEGYWNGTIKRVQTVDFNMLSHMLPTKLSLALISGDEQELQRTLDSNYGLFGLVVTDCKTTEIQCEQSILYSSESYRSWKDSLTLEILEKSDFDLLRNPAPLYPEGTYDSPRDHDRQATQFTNEGDVIGRIYYIRGGSPDFLSRYSDWIKGWPGSFLSDSGAYKFFSLTTILFLFGGFSSFLLLEFTRVISHRKQEFANRKLLKLKIQIRDSEEQISQLKTNLSNSQENVEDLSGKSLYLEQSISELREQLSEKERNSGTDEFENKQQLEHEIENLTKQVEAQESEIQKLSEKQQKGNNNEGNLRAIIKQKKSKQNKIQEELWAAQIKLKDFQDISFLREKIKFLEEQHDYSQSTRQKELEDKSKLEESLQKTKEECENYKLMFESLNKSLNHQQPPPKNSFEIAVLKTLKEYQVKHQGHWSVFDDIDVAPPGSNSMLTDCLVLGNSYIVAIEAKGYSGKISASRDLRNSSWFSKDRSGEKRLINSSWGRNPYKQVRTYAENALIKIKRRLSRQQIEEHNKIAFFGLIVFPDKADFAELSTNLGDYYQVLHLSELGGALLDIEERVNTRNESSNKTNFSFQDLEAYLFG